MSLLLDIDAIRKSAPPSTQIAETLERFHRAVLDKNETLADTERKKLATLLRKLQATADLVGRATMMGGYAGPKTKNLVPPDVDRVRAVFAIDEIAKRIPMLATSAEEVEKAYTEAHGFTLVRAAEEELVKRVQERIVSGLTKGIARDKTIEAIKKDGDFSRGYAQTVYDTNVATAYSAGRFREGELMRRQGLFVALRVRTSGRATTYDAHGHYLAGVRPTHRPMHNFIAAIDDPVWNHASPPYGFSCQCSASPIDRVDIPKDLFLSDGTLRRAQLPQGFEPTPGFGGRPDRTIYGAAS